MSLCFEFVIIGIGGLPWGKTSVEKHFDAMANDFEKVKRKVIPGYRDIEKCVFSYLPFTPSRKIAVLELGTGTGALALDY